MKFLLESVQTTFSGPAAVAMRELGFVLTEEPNGTTCTLQENSPKVYVEFETLEQVREFCLRHGPVVFGWGYPGPGDNGLLLGSKEQPGVLLFNERM